MEACGQVYPSREKNDARKAEGGGKDRKDGKDGRASEKQNQTGRIQMLERKRKDPPRQTQD